MFGAPRAGALDRDIFQRRIKFRECARALKSRMCPARRPTPGACLGHHKRARRAEQLPHFRELPRKQPSKDRMNVDARVVVAEPPGACARVIAVHGMIQTFAHEFGERNGAARANALGKNFGKGARVLPGFGDSAPGAGFGRGAGGHASWRCGLQVNISMMKSCRQS